MKVNLWIYSTMMDPFVAAVLAQLPDCCVRLNWVLLETTKLPLSFTSLPLLFLLNSALKLVIRNSFKAFCILVDQN